MARIQYFLANETRKEFCSFNDRAPIHEELKRIMDAWPTWKSTDVIKIKGENESNASDLWDYLTMNLEYKDLEYEQHMMN
jgi:hypothetical protein